MHVFFVYPDMLEGFESWTGYFYPGLGYLSAVLKNEGHSVSLLHLVKHMKKEQYLAEIELASPDLIAFSSTSLMFNHACQYATWAKQWKRNLPIVCGGIHPTIAPEDIIAQDCFDMACIGEGEYALLELCSCLEAGRDYSSIQSFWFKKGDEIVRNQLRPLVRDLDTLPFPDRTIFYQENRNKKHRVARVMASRGCPYQCAYCCNHTKMRLNGAAPQNYVRFRSVDNIISEIKQIRSENKTIQRVWFDDDILPLNRRWFREFAHKYKLEVNMPYECQTRVNLVDEEVVELLAESGCFRVSMGIESGNEKLRKTLMQRDVSDKQINRAFGLFHQYGIQTNSLNMIGLPTEDMSMALDTIKMNANVQPTRVSLYVFQPFKGSALYDYCVKNGINTDREATSILGDNVVGTDKLTKQQIVFIKRNFETLMNTYAQWKNRKWLATYGLIVLDFLLGSRFLSPPLCKFALLIQDIKRSTQTKIAALHKRLRIP